jgi:hydroxypyruvate isomerase
MTLRCRRYETNSLNTTAQAMELIECAQHSRGGGERVIMYWCCRCRYETNVLNTAAQAMDLIEGEVQHPNVFVHLDSYHMNIEESRWAPRCRCRPNSTATHVMFTEPTGRCSGCVWRSTRRRQNAATCAV